MAFDKKEIANLSNLLLSPEDLNTQLAFSILENQEFPLELITEVFAIYKVTSNKQLKQQAKSLLETHGSQELIWAMAMRYPLKGGSSGMAATEKTIKKNIIQYTHNNELDGVKLAKALYQKIGFGATYLLTATPQAQRKEILKTFITGTSFQLNNKALTQFPHEIFDFPELTKIDLSGNKITSIPKQIEVFENLEVLNLADNKLKSIHKNLLKLRKLESLDISENDFTKAFPEIIFEMTQLKKLNIIRLRNNWIFHQDLPESFFKMKNLEELYLSNGRYRTYPNYPQIDKVIGSPINLDPLEIAYAAFEQGDKHPISYLLKFGTSELILKVLNEIYDSTNQSMTFSGIYLEHLPKEITQFKIKRLSINGCMLGAYYGGGHNLSFDERVVEDKKRTAAISDLLELEYLDLSQNDLSEISDLSQLKKLKFLNLNTNKFIEFPEQYGLLENLEELYLLRTTESNSRIIGTRKIIEELQNLSKLKILKIGVSGLDYGDKFFKETLPSLLPNCKVNQF
ncbi:MAG: leucine-rich repeat domain-containing protein [Saprospiraceae bacterium]